MFCQNKIVVFLLPNYSSHYKPKKTKMKTFFSGIVIAGFVLASCSSGPADYSQLQDRNGIIFMVNSAKPFSGKVVNVIDEHILFEGSYKYGLRSDDWVFYHENGQVQTSGKYVDGLKDGQWPVWKENGLLDYYELYEMGNLLSGKPEIEEPEEEEVAEVVEEKKEVVKEKPAVRFVDWDHLRGGRTKHYEGVPYTGGFIQYYPDRTRKLVGYYKNGQRTGKWTHYDRTGKVSKVVYH